jgi:hypothetical protein
LIEILIEKIPSSFLEDMPYFDKNLYASDSDIAVRGRGSQENIRFGVLKGPVTKSCIYALTPHVSKRKASVFYSNPRIFKMISKFI